MTGGLPGVLMLLAIAMLALPASIVSAVTGSGTGILLSMVLLPVVGVAAVVPTLSVTMLIAHVGRVQAFRREIEIRPALLVLAGSVPGCLLGALVFAQLKETTLALIMAAFLLGLIAFRFVARREIPRQQAAIVIPCAFLYGLLAGTTIGGGILVLPLLMAAGLRGLPLVATDGLVGLVMNGVKAAVFSSLTLLTPELLMLGVLMGLFTLPGAWLARRLLLRVPERLHTLLLDGVVALASLMFLVDYMRLRG